MTISSNQSESNDLAQCLGNAAALVKTHVGVGNNAAWMACLDAFDHIRQHPAYRHKVKATYKQAFEELKAYERRLVFATSNRFFHLDDMSPETRKVYGNITDQEYYDFWAAFGYAAYADTMPLYTSLVNKFRLAYVNNNVPHPDILAWSTAAGYCLDIAVDIYNTAIQSCVENWKHLGLPAKAWEKLFASFNISKVVKTWEKAHFLLVGNVKIYVDEMLGRNIELARKQLMEKWLDEDTLFGARLKTSEDYAEVFRTKGELKKVQRDFAELRNEMKRIKDEEFRTHLNTRKP